VSVGLLVFVFLCMCFELIGVGGLRVACVWWYGWCRPLLPHAVACENSMNPPYLVTFILLKDVLIWKALPCGVYGSRDNLCILRAGGLYALAGFSVSTFSGGGLVKISVSVVSCGNTPLAGGTLATARRHGNNAVRGFNNGLVRACVLYGGGVMILPISYLCRDDRCSRVIFEVLPSNFYKIFLCIRVTPPQKGGTFNHDILSS